MRHMVLINDSNGSFQYGRVLNLHVSSVRAFLEMHITRAAVIKIVPTKIVADSFISNAQLLSYLVNAAIWQAVFDPAQLIE